MTCIEWKEVRIRSKGSRGGEAGTAVCVIRLWLESQHHKNESCLNNSLMDADGSASE